MKKTLSVLLAAAMMFLLTACSGSKWVGNYAGTNSAGEAISMEFSDDQKVVYTRGDVVYHGTWEEQGEELRLYFGGRVGLDYAPLKVTISSDGNSIIVDAPSKYWKADTYIRQ